MPYWGKGANANAAPKFITDIKSGETGVEEFGHQILYVDGTEGYPVTPGWVRRYSKGSRTLWESLATHHSGQAGIIIIPPSKQTIFDHDTVTLPGNNEPGIGVSLGFVFSPLTKGQVRAVSFFKTANDVATSRSVALYNMSGNIVASGTSTAEPAGPGWISIALSSPYTVEATTMLVASVHFPQGSYPAQTSVFDTVIRHRQILAESNAGGNGNGRFNYGSSIEYPDLSAGSTSFGIDVDFYQDPYPTAQTTGVPSGTTLTPMTGEIHLWSGGQTVLENVNLNGFILVQAENCVIRNCKIANNDAGAAAVIRIDTGSTDGEGLVIENCEINGAGITVNGIAGQGTFTGNKITGVDNGINLYGPSVIKENYIYLQNGTADAHFDGIENNGVSDVVIQHNTIHTNVGQTSAIMLNNYYNGLANIKIIDNYLSGGAYTVYCDNSKSGAAVDAPSIQVMYNKIGTGAFGYFSLYTSGVTPQYNYDAVTDDLIV